MSREKIEKNCNECLHFKACCKWTDFPKQIGFPTCRKFAPISGYRKQSEDTVEVVRCKDCKYWKDTSFDTVTEDHWGECRKPLGDYRYCETAENDFCSYGAKMKGGGE